MSYERDTDSVTRGVGAIAAADHVSPGRHERRVQVGRDLRRRDRAMSLIAQGALGRMVLPTDGAMPAKVATTIRPYPLSPGAVRVIMPGRIVGQSTPHPIRVPPTVRLPPVSIPTGPVVVKDPGVGSAVPAVPPAVVPPGMTNKPPPPVYIGGGGGTVASSKGVAPGSSPPLIDPSQIPSVEETTASAADHTTRNVVLLAAGAGALTYFLFFRRRAL